MTVVEVAASAGPYRGLAPFGDSEADALLFFGRERETEVAAANVLASRLTVLYGPSGVGKSSLLRAGVARRLRALAEGDPLAVVVFSSWGGDPLAGIAETARASVAEALGYEPATEAEGTLADRLGAWAAELGGDLCLVLDQLEELFLYHGGGRDEAFARELAEVVTRPSLRVSVLLGIREDALARLDAFKAHIPNLFGNYLRLDRLDREAAREAIVGPLGLQDDAEIEPALVETVLDQVAAGRIETGLAGLGAVDDVIGDGRIEAPYLQLVMQRLWEVERERGSNLLRVRTLEDLGGAQRIVEDHLDRAMQALTPRQQDAAASVFGYLVTPSGTKIAHGVPDLASYASLTERELASLLDSLARERIVRPLRENGDAARYEIFHDVLAGAVLAWRTRHDAEQRLRDERGAARRRQRRLLAVAATAVVALAVMTVVAAYAIDQRREARQQERSARADELAARALVQLEVDPQQSLQWALAAAEIEATEQSETVLRRALLEARLRRSLRVGGAVTVVEHAPDGSRVLIGTASGAAVVWAPDRGRVVRRFSARGGPVVAARYDAGGSKFVVARGREAIVWESSSGRRLATVTHARAIGDAAFSGDGRRLLTASDDHTVRITEIPSGERVQVVRRPGPVKRAAMSSDGRTLVVVAEDEAGRVHSSLYRDGQFVRVLDARGVADVEFSPDGRFLATSNHDGSTHLWDPRTGKGTRVLDDKGTAVVDVAFSPDSTFLATAGSDGGVRVWVVATGARFFYFVGHTSPLLRVRFCPTGAYVVSTSVDRTARVWQVDGIEAGKQVALLVGHDAAVTAVAISPDGGSIVTGSNDATVRVWDGEIEQRLETIANFPTEVEAEAAADGRYILVQRLGEDVLIRRRDGRRQVLPQPVGDAELSPDGEVIATGSNSVQLAPTDEPARRRMLPAPLADVVGLRFSPDGATMAAFGHDSTVAVWRLPARRPVVLDEPNLVSDVALFQSRAATAGSDGIVRIWDTDRGRLLGVLDAIEGGFNRIRFSPTGEVVAAAGSDGTARLWRASGEALHVLRGHEERLTDVNFDATGDRLVTTSEGSSKNAMVWDVRTGRRLFELVGHFGTVTTAEFSDDGRWIVTAGPIAAAVWSADSGRLLFYLRGHEDLLTSASFLPGGHDVLTSARDGTVRVYRCEVCAPLDGLVELARRRLAAAR